MTYFSVRSTEAVCDKPGSGQPVLLARFRPNILPNENWYCGKCNATDAGACVLLTLQATGCMANMHVTKSTLNCEARQ
jgi:hypothetical protein